MKKVMFYAVALAIGMSASSCRTQSTVAQAPTKSTNPFGETFEAPCQVMDSETEFAATGIYRGSMEQKGELQLNARQNALQSIREKFAHSYRGIVSNYSDSYGSNKGNDISTKLSRAGDQVINAELDHARDVCVKYSSVGDDGKIECYVAVLISKTEVARKTAKAVSDALTAEEKLLIDFREDEYRQKMEERLTKFRENR